MTPAALAMQNSSIKIGSFEQQEMMLNPEKAFKADLQIAEATANLEPSLVEKIYDLAIFYCMQRDYSSAEKLYRKVLRVQEKLPSTNPQDIVNCLEKLAIVVAESGNKQEALSLRYRAFILKTKI